MMCIGCFSQFEKGDAVFKVKHSYGGHWAAGDYCSECIKDKFQSGSAWVDGRFKEVTNEGRCAKCSSPVTYVEPRRPRKGRAGVFCSPSCASAYSQRHRPKVRHIPKACAKCKEKFTPKRSDAKFCSTRCRVAKNRERMEAGAIVVK